jgi:arsenite methyltransferase
MSLADVVAGQLRMPHGVLAPLAARSLNKRNADLIRDAVEALDVGPGQSVLDVGFGGALSLRLLLHRVGDGRVYGIDPSAEMVRRAARLLAGDVRRGRLVVRTGTATAIPFGDGTFDRVLTSQTVYFWTDVPAGLDEIHRVLAPDGRCALAMMPRPVQESLGFAQRGYNLVSHADLGRWLAGSGFVRVIPPPCGPRSRWVLVARKP